MPLSPAWPTCSCQCRRLNCSPAQHAADGVGRPAPSPPWWRGAEPLLLLAAGEADGAAPRPRLATLMVQCPDKKGVVAALGQLLYGLGCNIVESDQWTDADSGTYFQR